MGAVYDKVLDTAGKSLYIIIFVFICCKASLKRPLKIDKTKILMPDGSSMKVERISAECSSFNTFDLH